MALSLRHLGVRVFIAIYLGLAVLSVYFIHTGYFGGLKMAEQGELARLKSITATLSMQVDGDEMAALLQRFPLWNNDTMRLREDSIYLKYVDLFRAAYGVNGLKTPIYTLTREAVDGRLFIGVASNGPQVYGLHYASHVEEHLDIYESGGVIPRYEDDYGVWLSALCPIVDSEGNVVAALEADIPFDSFLMYAREDLLRNVLYALLLFVAVGAVLTLFIRRVLQEDAANRRALDEAHLRIARKKDDLESSIRYAAQIQANIYPREEEMAAFLRGHTVLDMPHGVVSGDFHWFHRLGHDRALLAVCDCTGHGVPGALMSIMGNNFLNGGILLGHTTPRALLEHLDHRVCETFHSSGNSTDGMDIGLCLIDRRAQTITYCGAKRPLTIIAADGSTATVEGARRSIGQGRMLGGSVPFVETVLPIDPTAIYFLYSDGLQDQFGGPKSRKLGHRRLLQWLTELSAAPLTAATATELRRRITAWQGSEEQTDDMCLMGFGVYSER